MYNSEISVSDLVNKVLTAINVSPEIPGQTVAGILQDLQNRLYRQVLRPMRHSSLSLQAQGDIKYFTMNHILPSEAEDVSRLEDLCDVFVESKRLLCVDKERFFAMSIPVYTYMDGKICLRNVTCDTVTVVYLVRPAPITYTESEGYGGSIRMPIGYASLLEAGLHASLCRYIGDDDGYQRYATAYNDLLSDLKSCYPCTTGEGDQ